jgi:hypothetical protein
MTATTLALAAAVLASLTDGSHDIVVRRATVPRTGSPQGEVRLVERNHAVVMQTLLESRVIVRVAREIALKEDRGWPETDELRAQSRRYVDALTEAAQAVFHEHARRPELRDQPQRLVIEFVLAPDASVVALYELPAGELRDRDRLTERKLVRSLDLDRAYVERNVTLIAEDSLGMDADLVRRETARIFETNGGALAPPPP